MRDTVPSHSRLASVTASDTGRCPGRPGFARTVGAWPQRRPRIPGTGAVTSENAVGPAARGLRAYNRRVERQDVTDRQLDALLERLDRLCAEMHTLNRRLDTAEHLARISHELRALNESLQALAYAALGQSGPQVRRRRAG